MCNHPFPLPPRDVLGALSPLKLLPPLPPLVAPPEGLEGFGEGEGPVFVSAFPLFHRHHGRSRRPVLLEVATLPSMSLPPAYAPPFEARSADLFFAGRGRQDVPEMHALRSDALLSTCEKFFSILETSGCPSVDSLLFLSQELFTLCTREAVTTTEKTCKKPCPKLGYEQ